MSEALLLDTHVWLWLIADGRAQMSGRAWLNIEQHAERNALAVSEISFWELATKAAKGNLQLLPNLREWLKTAARKPGFGIVEVDRDILVQSAELDFPRRDPADRILVATALRYDLRLATADTPILRYAEQNSRLMVLDCRAS